jgi:YYY domain-containing protein
MEWLEVAKWWIVLEVIGLAALPLTVLIFRNLDSKGVALSRILGLVLVTYFSWILANLGFNYNLTIIGLALIILFVISILVFYKRGCSIDRNELIRTEILFAATFLLFVIIRGFSPEIYWSGGEKFMDMSFVNMILRSTSFPPMDPWMSGESMQYYYFGYLVVANLIKLSFVPSAIGYNLAMATMFALSSTAAYGLGKELTHSKVFGIITMGFVTVFGNIAGFIQLLVILFIPGFYGLFNVPNADIWTRLSTYYYWPTSRVIPNTINEFPYFSFIHADLHPQMISIAFQLLMIGLLLGLMRSGKEYNIPLFATITLVLGFMFPLNSWEYPTYAIFFIMALIAWRIRVTAELENASGIKERVRALSTSEMIRTIGAGVIVGILSIALYLPYYLASTESHSLKLVTYGHTQMFFYLGVYAIMLFFIMFYTIASFSDSSYLDIRIMVIGLGIAIVAAYLTQIQILIVILPLIVLSAYSVIKEENPTNQFVYLLILTGALLSLFCELFYIQDSLGVTYPKYIRLNTVFKIYLQNWIIWGLAAGVSFYHLWDRFGHSRNVNKVFALISIVLIFAALTYPVLATISRSDNFEGHLTLDGSAYINEQYPNEFEAVMWLNKLTGTPIVLQSPGRLYELNNHVTAFTGLPTVMGWGGHEKNWRNNKQPIDERWNEVGSVYTSGNIDTVNEILEKYHVDYVYVGGVEMERYNGYDALNTFEDNPDRFELVYFNPNVHIYKLVRSDD